MPGLQQELDDDTVKQERLKAALWHAIGKNIDAIGVNQNLNATSRFIGALSEMCWAQIETVAHDLESFAAHDGERTVIRSKDVLLLARRNDGLRDLLKATAEGLEDQT